MAKLYTSLFTFGEWYSLTLIQEMMSLLLDDVGDFGPYRELASLWLCDP